MIYAMVFLGGVVMGIFIKWMLDGIRAYAALPLLSDDEIKTLEKSKTHDIIYYDDTDIVFSKREGANSIRSTPTQAEMTHIMKFIQYDLIAISHETYSYVVYEYNPIGKHRTPTALSDDLL